MHHVAYFSWTEAETYDVVSRFRELGMDCFEAGGAFYAFPECPGDDDPRRRTYRLTASGRRALAEELSRLDELVAEGRRLGVLGGKAGS